MLTQKEDEEVISGADLKQVLPEALAGKSANCCDDEG